MATTLCWPVARVLRRLMLPGEPAWQFILALSLVLYPQDTLLLTLALPSSFRASLHIAPWPVPSAVLAGLLDLITA